MPVAILVAKTGVRLDHTKYHVCEMNKKKPFVQQKLTTNSEQKALILEVPPRFELGNRGFEDLSLTTWLWHQKTMEFALRAVHASFPVHCHSFPSRKRKENRKMERMTRLELATSTLARWRSTR